MLQPSGVAVALLAALACPMGRPACALLASSDADSQGGHWASRRLSSFEERVEGASLAQLDISRHVLDNPQVEQLLVLTVQTPEGNARLHTLLQSLSQSLAGLNIEPFVGLDWHKASNEEEEMEQPNFELTPKQRVQWLQMEIGFGPVHKGVPSEAFHSNGALACSIGHYRMWEMARNATAGKWTVILEDDAMPAAGLSAERLLRTLGEVPQGAEEVFLDDRHCSRAMRIGGVVKGKMLSHYAYGSTAYAVTPAGAAALLDVPFRYAADHWLNVPVENGAVDAFCPPEGASFVHDYPHPTTISLLHGFQHPTAIE